MLTDKNSKVGKPLARAQACGSKGKKLDRPYLEVKMAFNMQLNDEIRN